MRPIWGLLHELKGDPGRGMILHLKRLCIVEASEADLPGGWQIHGRRGLGGGTILTPAHKSRGCSPVPISCNSQELCRTLQSSSVPCFVVVRFLQKKKENIFGDGGPYALLYAFLVLIRNIPTQACDVLPSSTS